MDDEPSVIVEDVLEGEDKEEDEDDDAGEAARVNSGSRYAAATHLSSDGRVLGQVLPLPACPTILPCPSVG
jgi:hypothetical protein